VEKIRLVDGHTLLMPLTMGPGYAEESFIILAKASGGGKVEVQVRLGDKTEIVKGDMACPDLESIRSSFRLVDEGVYPIRHQAHKVSIKRELKNYIKVKEDIFSTFHRLFGEEESYDKPAGMVCGILENNTKFNLPLRVKFSVLDESGKEIPYFRGEHIQREEAGAPPVPEAIIGVGAAAARDFEVPLFADVYSVKPGIYRGMLTVSFFGTNTDIAVREFNLHVEKESQIQIITGLVAVFLSLVSLLLVAFYHKKWIGRLKTSEIILIALFTAVKFSIVDIPWFIFGDVIRAALGPLGPFMHIFTGIFWDIINAMFLVTLVLLVPKPGVVIISSVVRIILHSVAFGTFNPITVLLMLSYAVLADALLYVTGFTSGKRAFKECFMTFTILGVIFIIKHIYSTYTFYYIWISHLRCSGTKINSRFQRC
jgi:ABC-type thiamin/hydroxymethylpyrimidine transport system permease subunit